MTPPRSLLAALLVVLAACQTMDAPPLDEYTLTTANGVRFRTLSGINDSCDTSVYSDAVGWGAYHVRVDQDGKVRENPKFNFASPSQDPDDRAVLRAGADMLILTDEFHWACVQWQLAPQDEKSVYLGYFREAITLTFEAATRFEAGGRIGPDSLRAEVDLMRSKRDKLVAHKPIGRVL